MIRVKGRLLNPVFSDGPDLDRVEFHTGSETLPGGINKSCVSPPFLLFSLVLKAELLSKCF